MKKLAEGDKWDKWGVYCSKRYGQCKARVKLELNIDIFDDYPC